MSIIGAAATSLATYVQQLPKTNVPRPAAQPSTAQTFAQQAAAAQTASQTQASLASLQTGQVHPHHHRHGGGGASNPGSDLLQTGTASAGGTNILNTLV